MTAGASSAKSDEAASTAVATTDQLLTAVLAVLLDEREHRVQDCPGTRKPETLLVDAGLPVPVVASLLGKQPGAVRMAVTRAKAKASGKEVKP